jgi:hypothetical protein
MDKPTQLKAKPKKKPAAKKPDPFKPGKGRPTKMTATLMRKAARYVDVYESLDEKVPSVAGLASYIDVNRSTVQDWRGNSPDFSAIVEKILEKQELKLLSNGLTGDYNASIAKLMLTKHGYSDKVETDNSTTLSGKVTSAFNFLPVGADD